MARAGTIVLVPRREERIAENEVRFRTANEDLRSRWDELEMARPDLTLFLCECGDRSCTQVIRMTLDEYEAVRGDPNTFAVLLGHEDTPTEKTVTEAVVDANDRFAVVKKRDDYRKVTEPTDPR